MTKKNIVVAGLIYGAFVVLLSVCFSSVVFAGDAAGSHPHVQHLEHIETLAEAKALKAGDTIAMACSMCKNISIYNVDETDAHLKLMTIGDEHTCPVCQGTVQVVGTGKSSGGKATVKHVCAKCGENAMFVAATRKE